MGNSPAGSRPRSSKSLAYGTAALCSRIVLKTAFQLAVRSPQRIPESGPLIVVANHQSYLDGPVLAATFRRRLVFLSAQYLFERRLLGRLLHTIGALPVTPGEGNLSSLKAAIAVLGDGGTVAVFPGGGIARDAVLGGSVFLALKSGAPLLPVHIAGTKQALPPGKRLPHLCPITVSVGSPITPAELRVTGGRNRRAAIEAGCEMLARSLAESDTVWRDICPGPRCDGEGA